MAWLQLHVVELVGPYVSPLNGLPWKLFGLLFGGPFWCMVLVWDAMGEWASLLVYMHEVTWPILKTHQMVPFYPANSNIGYKDSKFIFIF